MQTGQKSELLQDIYEILKEHKWIMLLQTDFLRVADVIAQAIIDAGFIKKSEIRVDENELEKVLGDIKIPIDESWCEVEETSNPAVIILKSKWARKIVKAISLNLTKIVK